MSEKLAAHSSVVLFGKVVEDLTIKVEQGDTSDPKFARIYGFSYAGAFHDMDETCLIRVHGDGTPAHETKVPGPGLDDDDPFYKSLMTWTYDEGDRTTILEVESGSFEDLLSMDDDDGLSLVAGKKVSGKKVAGKKVAGKKVSGKKVAGKKVSGKKLSGLDYGD